MITEEQFTDIWSKAYVGYIRACGTDKLKYINTVSDEATDIADKAISSLLKSKKKFKKYIKEEKPEGRKEI